MPLDTTQHEGMMLALRRSWVIWLSTLFFLTACAAPAKPATEAGQAAWSGRLSIKVQTDPVQQTSGSFSLVGNPQAGELELFTPVGSKFAQITWSPAQTLVTTAQGTQSFLDLQNALQSLTGADIPVQQFFKWLSGTSDAAFEASLGWKVDLSSHTNGKIVAMRVSPDPQMEIRVILVP